MGIFNDSEKIELIQEMLKSGECVSLNITGKSMNPFLKDGIDTVVLKSFDHYSKGDVVLFLKNGNTPVLHRIYRMSGEKFSAVGDAQTMIETGIDASWILGKAVSVTHNGRPLSDTDIIWKFYENFWTVMPIRKALFKIHNSMKRKIR
jgi:signal peptidase